MILEKEVKSIKKDLETLWAFVQDAIFPYIKTPFSYNGWIRRIRKTLEEAEEESRLRAEKNGKRLSGEKSVEQVEHPNHHPTVFGGTTGSKPKLEYGSEEINQPETLAGFARQTASIKQIIEIYNNGHESVFYPDTYIIVRKEDLIDLIEFMEFDDNKCCSDEPRGKGYREEYLSENILMHSDIRGKPLDNVVATEWLYHTLFDEFKEFPECPYCKGILIMKEETWKCAECNQDFELIMRLKK